MRDDLIEKIHDFFGVDSMYFGVDAAALADHLLADGWIRPPCKVGDTIYLPWEWKDTSGVAILTVERMSITEAGCSIRTDLWSDDEDYWLAYNCGVFRFDDIGKTVFLTREQAERALEERSAE